LVIPYLLSKDVVLAGACLKLLKLHTVRGDAVFAPPNIKVYSPPPAKDKDPSRLPPSKAPGRQNPQSAGKGRDSWALPGARAALMDAFAAWDGHCFVHAAGEEENQLQSLRTSTAGVR